MEEEEGEGKEGAAETGRGEEEVRLQTGKTPWGEPNFIIVLLKYFQILLIMRENTM